MQVNMQLGHCKGYVQAVRQTKGETQSACISQFSENVTYRLLKGKAKRLSM